VENLIRWVEGLKRELEIPTSIKEAGVAEADFLAQLDAIAVDAFDDQCTGANPRYPLIEEFRAILLDSYYGRPFAELTERHVFEAAQKQGHRTGKVAAKAEVRVQEPVLAR